MAVSPDHVHAKLDGGRHATAAWLRRLADDLDALSLDHAAEVPTWLGDRLAQLQRDVERLLSAQSLAAEPSRPALRRADGDHRRERRGGGERHGHEEQHVPGPGSPRPST